MPLAVLNLGAGEWVLVFVVILVIFGSGKIPQIGSSLGKGIKNFRSAVKGEEEAEVKAEDKTPKA